MHYHLILPFPDSRLNPNRKMNVFVKNRIFQKAKNDAYYLAKAAEIPKGSIPVQIMFFPPDERRRDMDNMIASFKAYQDGIALAVGLDDSIFRPSYEIGEIEKNGKVVVMFSDEV